MFTTVTASLYCNISGGDIYLPRCFLPIITPRLTPPTGYCHLALINFVPVLCFLIRYLEPELKLHSRDQPFCPSRGFHLPWIPTTFPPCCLSQNFPMDSWCFLITHNALHLLPQVPLCDPLELFNQISKTLKRTTVRFPSLYFSQS